MLRRDTLERTYLQILVNPYFLLFCVHVDRISLILGIQGMPWEKGKRPVRFYLDFT